MFSVTTDTHLAHCEGISRRELLRIGSLGLGGLGLGSLMGNPLTAADSKIYKDRSVVLLFLQGGPPQVETFDPNLDAPSEIRSCTGGVQTKHAGVHFGGTFPELAKRVDRFSVVRSFASGDGGHNQLPVLTGNSPTEATMGSQIGSIIGSNHPKTSLPTHTVVLPEEVQPSLKLGTPTGPFSYQYIQKNYVTAGKLGQQYDALLLDGRDELKKNFTLSLPRQRFDDRRLLMSQLDQYRQRLESSVQFQGFDAVQAQACEVLLKGITEAFDLSKENPRTIAKYDTSHLFRMHDWHKGGSNYNNLRNQSRVTNLLGKQMLMARRLCEAGCGFVTVVDGCWDFHGDGNNPPTPVGMPLLGPQADHAIAVFLDDLEDRGLSDKIMLVVTGEMGRSPKKGGRNGGTGHWSRLTPLLVAGGGLQMGKVIGETDKSGGEATTQQYLPENLLATIMQTLFDQGEARLLTGLSEVAQTITNGKPITELMP